MLGRTYSHPTKWVLNRKIKLEVGANRAKIALSSTVQKIKNRKLFKKNMKFQTLCESTKNSELVVEEFLTQVGNNIRAQPRL